ncbi:putative odorant receptor 83c [Toxorhynchites rutilus septentrionalis]|uniref:putative odorant receptor 83c n=1 Tax=Toxorhynchites rutilus septentrionalis TaxID=329112 RepID=UPI00247B2D2A|nr:putative odorant receptor 83c [Toxorhynchites rutilus septentrionalis]
MSKRETIQEYERILRWQHWILKLIGCDVYSVNFRVTSLTVTIVFLACFFVAVSFVDLYLFRDDVYNFMFVLVTLFYAIVGCCRLGFMLTSSKSFSSLVAEAKETYKQASSDDSQQQILFRYTKLLKQCVTIYSLSFIGGSIIAAILPLIFYPWDGRKMLPFGVVLPFFDPSSEEAYQLNYIYQISCILWTPPGLTATQNIYFVLAFNICIQYEILIVKLDELDTMIATSAEESKGKAIHEMIAEIIRYQHKVARFTAEIERLYSMQLFVEISSNALQIVMTLFVLHIDIWMPGYLIIFISTFQLFIFSFLGTLLEIKSDMFCERLYSVSWHSICNEEQKNIRFMLQQSQHPVNLTYGGVLPLNMNLFLSDMFAYWAESSVQLTNSAH